MEQLVGKCLALAHGDGIGVNVTSAVGATGPNKCHVSTDGVALMLSVSVASMLVPALAALCAGAWLRSTNRLRTGADDWHIPAAAHGFTADGARLYLVALLALMPLVWLLRGFFDGDWHSTFQFLTNCSQLVQFIACTCAFVGLHVVPYVAKARSANRQGAEKCECVPTPGDDALPLRTILVLASMAQIAFSLSVLAVVLFAFSFFATTVSGRLVFLEYLWKQPLFVPGNTLLHHVPFWFMLIYFLLSLDVYSEAAYEVMRWLRAPPPGPCDANKAMPAIIEKIDKAKVRPELEQFADDARTVYHKLGGGFMSRPRTAAFIGSAFVFSLLGPAAFIGLYSEYVEWACVYRINEPVEPFWEAGALATIVAVVMVACVVLPGFVYVIASFTMREDRHESWWYWGHRGGELCAPPYTTTLCARVVALCVNVGWLASLSASGSHHWAVSVVSAAVLCATSVMAIIRMGAVAKRAWNQEDRQRRDENRAERVQFFDALAVVAHVGIFVAAASNTKWGASVDEWRLVLAGVLMLQNLVVFSQLMAVVWDIRDNWNWAQLACCSGWAVSPLCCFIHPYRRIVETLKSRRAARTVETVETVETGGTGGTSAAGGGTGGTPAAGGGTVETFEPPNGKHQGNDDDDENLRSVVDPALSLVAQHATRWGARRAYGERRDATDFVGMALGQKARTQKARTQKARTQKQIPAKMLRTATSLFRV